MFESRRVMHTMLRMAGVEEAQIDATREVPISMVSEMYREELTRVLTFQTEEVIWNYLAKGIATECKEADESELHRINNTAAKYRVDFRNADSTKPAFTLGYFGLYHRFLFESSLNNAGQPGYVPSHDWYHYPDFSRWNFRADSAVNRVFRMGSFTLADEVNNTLHDYRTQTAVVMVMSPFASDKIRSFSHGNKESEWLSRMNAYLKMREILLRNRGLQHRVTDIVVPK